MIHEKINLSQFMGQWYVQTGRFTYFEKDAYNAVELYTWNEDKDRIDIEFSFNKKSLNGELKSIAQKGWVYNHETNTHWKVSPLWPIKLDYLIVYVDPNYEWTAIGVPDQKYLWVMSRAKNPPREQADKIIEILRKKNYNISKLTQIEHDQD
jgi:apolipoprotein D and lipocalin family protein